LYVRGYAVHGLQDNLNNIHLVFVSNFAMPTLAYSHFEYPVLSRATTPRYDYDLVHELERLTPSSHYAAGGFRLW
jgi:hypothetical protein